MATNLSIYERVKRVTERKNKLLKLRRDRILKSMQEEGFDVSDIELKLEKINFLKIDSFLEAAAKRGIRPRVIGTSKIADINKAMYVFNAKRSFVTSRDELMSLGIWTETTFAQVNAIMYSFDLWHVEGKNFCLTEQGRKFLDAGKYDNLKRGAHILKLTAAQKIMICDILRDTSYSDINSIKMHILCALRFCCNFFAEGGFRPIRKGCKLRCADLFTLNTFFYTDYEECNEVTTAANDLLIVGINYCKELGLVASLKDGFADMEIYAPTNLGLDLLKGLEAKVK
jgi:hypothetical protein